MKTLAITFFTAIAIISVALACDFVSSTASANANSLIGHTTVTRDSHGRVVSEVTVALVGKEWQETTMKKYSYSDGLTEVVSYNKVDGSWAASSKVVSESADGIAVSNTYYVAAPNGSKWVEVGQQLANDLSSDDVLDDYVFDANGNLVMKATYVYHNGEKLGISKEEYAYEDNAPKTRVSYAWNGDSWDRALAAEYVAE